MAKRDIDWGNIGFGYIKTDMRYVSLFRDGKWDDGVITDDDRITLSVPVYSSMHRPYSKD